MTLLSICTLTGRLRRYSGDTRNGLILVDDRKAENINSASPEAVEAYRVS